MTQKLENVKEYEDEDDDNDVEAGNAILVNNNYLLYSVAKAHN